MGEPTRRKKSIRVSNSDSIGTPPKKSFNEDSDRLEQHGHKKQKKSAEEELSLQESKEYAMSFPANQGKDLSLTIRNDRVTIKGKISKLTNEFANDSKLLRFKLGIHWCSLWASDVRNMGFQTDDLNWKILYKKLSYCTRLTVRGKPTMKGSTPFFGVKEIPDIVNIMCAQESSSYLKKEENSSDDEESADSEDSSDVDLFNISRSYNLTIKLKRTNESTVGKNWDKVLNKLSKVSALAVTGKLKEKDGYLYLAVSTID
jgi:hypothetical protein